MATTACDFGQAVCALFGLCSDKARETESTSTAARLKHNILGEVKCFTPPLDKNILKEQSFLPSYPNPLIEWK